MFDNVFLLSIGLAAVISFALGMVLDAPGSLAYGFAFAIVWYMAMGGASIIYAAANAEPLAPLLWFTLYGVGAVALLLAFCVIGTLIGMARRFVLRLVEDGDEYR